MDQDPIKDLAGKWYEKLNDPSTAVYRLTHARRGNSAVEFDPNAVLQQYRKTSDERMERFADAAKELLESSDNKRS